MFSVFVTIFWLQLTDVSWTRPGHPYSAGNLDLIGFLLTVQWIFASGATAFFGLTTLFDPYFKEVRISGFGIVIFSIFTIWLIVLGIDVYSADFSDLATGYWLYIRPHTLASLLAALIIWLGMKENTENVSND